MVLSWLGHSMHATVNRITESAHALIEWLKVTPTFRHLSVAVATGYDSCARTLAIKEMFFGKAV